jgi:hypothetical protein
MHEAVRANVRAATDHLRHGSELLEQLIRDEGLVVVGADYSLESGIVTFFDGAGAATATARAKPPSRNRRRPRRNVPGTSSRRSGARPARRTTAKSNRKG